ncbi:MAG: LPXTG cell wall anchor domain-containing protein [Candidatus Spyradocola sp.]
MKNRKSLRTLCAVVAALLLCVCFPIAANADNADGVTYYTVTYSDGAGGFLFPTQTYKVAEGSETPDFVGTSPTFDGMYLVDWEPWIAEKATHDVTYTARWFMKDVPSADAYTVVYTDGVDDEEVFPDKVITGLAKYADTPSFGLNPTRQGYKFTGWDPEENETVTASVVYVAQWEPVNNEETPGDSASNPPSGTPTPSQGTIYYPNYDVTPTPAPTAAAPTAQPDAGEDVSPKTGASEVSVIALAIVALAAVALMVGTMRKRAE